jgi:outer membrane protein
MKCWVGLIALAACLPIAAGAQDTTSHSVADTLVSPRIASTVSLSLAEALDRAHGNSPAYRQVLNDANPARWGVRNAYGSFVPSVTGNASMGYTGSGRTDIGGGFIQSTSAYLTSGYSLMLTWQLDGHVLSGPGQQKALQKATDEDISGAGVQLKFDITTQYLNSLQAAAQVEVARQQVRRNADFLTLAQARYRVGQATLLDVRQAEVTKGQSDVALLRAVQLDNEAKLELLRQMGVEPPVPVEQITLSDSFPVTPPEFQLDQLLALADQENPVLRSLRARQGAANWGVRAAKSEFLPSLAVQAGWSGFTQELTDEDLLLGSTLGAAQNASAQCQYNNQVKTALDLGGVQDCFGPLGLNNTGTALTPGAQANLLDANNVFPFDYTAQPFFAVFRLSLPIFTGFSRSLRLSEARAAEEDADEDVRARRLAVHTDVRARHLGLVAAYRAIAVQQANRVSARDQLRLAQDRYRLGAGTSLEVADAQSAVQQAEGDYVNAVYFYHKAIAALEAAVGRPLR